MGKFLPGLFIGVAIGLLIAPKKGDEMRLEIGERWKDVKNKLANSSSPAMDTSTAINDNADPITLPIDSLEAAKPTTSPLSSTATSRATFGRTSTDSMDPGTTIKTTAINKAAPNPATTPAKPFTDRDTTEDAENTPITTPVETFEEIPEDKNTTTQKLDTPYQNPGKSNTTSRWLSNNQNRRV